METVVEREIDSLLLKGKILIDQLNINIYNYRHLQDINDSYVTSATTTSSVMELMVLENRMKKIRAEVLEINNALINIKYTYKLDTDQIEKINRFLYRCCMN